MKFTAERNDLAKALSTASRIVERRTTIPILSNVRLRAGAEALEVTATDMDLEARVLVHVAVEAEGETTVNAHILADAVRKAAEGGQILIEADDKSATLRSGRSRFQLHVLPAGDFPELTPHETNHRFNIPARALLSVIDDTSFSISTEATRHYLNGIFFHVVGEGEAARLTAVATDGHRLSKTFMAAPDGSGGMPGVIVPRKTCTELARILKDAGDAEIECQVGTAAIRFAVDSLTLTSKLIDGTFPDYERVIPANNQKRAVVDRLKLIGGVDRVSTISSERGRAVKLRFEEGKLLLFVNNADAGEAEDEIEIDWRSDEPLEIGFNARYLLESLSVLGGEKIALDLHDPGSPTLIRAMNGEVVSDQPGITLMPMRV